MAPNLTGTATGLFLAEAEVISTPKAQPQPQPPRAQKQYQRPQYRWKIVWRNTLAFIYIHMASVYAIYLVFAQARFYTFLWGTMFAFLGAMGITAGAHRLWAHKSYKAKWPLRFMLMIFQTIAFQNHIYEWVRDHRVHHKFTDTDADPHNSKRGFFFSHMGWLMVRKHDDVKTKGKTVDLSDLEKDWVVMFQKKYYPVMMPFFCFIFPCMVPCYFWNELPWNSWYIASILRYTVSLNFTWLVNSAAHIWGTKPYDNTISPTENKSVAILAFGEGWHNYHHAFPWDYKTSEFGDYKYNLSAAFIDFFARMGWAYDLKTVPVEMVKRRAKRLGDGTHYSCREDGPKGDHHGDKIEFWGWGDKDMTKEDKEMVSIIHRKSD